MRRYPEDHAELETTGRTRSCWHTENGRISFRVGCDGRVDDPAGLPVKDEVLHEHEKVQELRDLSRWRDGHSWISPEQHGNLVSDQGETEQRPRNDLDTQTVLGQ